MDDQELIALAKENPARFMEEVCQQFGTEIYNRIIKIVEDPGRAEELTQDVLLKVFQNIQTFSGKSSLRTWVWTIARNLALDDVSKNRKTPSGSYEELRTTELSDETPDSESRLLEEERREQLKAAIKKLPVDTKVVLLLGQVGFSYKLIAEIVGRPWGSVGRDLFDSRIALRKLLSGYLHAG